MPLRFPNDTQRHSIMGQTGSGKTVFGMWCLSQRSYDRMPWIIIDVKRDDLIERIPRLTEIDARDKPPKRRGLYVVRPDVLDFENGVMTQFLYKIWENENTGLFIDEGYAFKARDPGLRTVLTQGRSKHVPVISLSQKPSWVSPFLFSESEFKSVFYLDMPNDIERVTEWMPRMLGGRRVDPSTLPPHTSYWRSGPYREFALLGQCPPPDDILTTFDERMPRRVFM